MKEATLLYVTATELCYCIIFSQSNRHSLTKVSPPTYNLLDYVEVVYPFFEWKKCALVNILCYVVHFNIGPSLLSFKVHHCFVFRLCPQLLLIKLGLPIYGWAAPKLSSHL